MVKHRGFTFEKFINAVGEELLRGYFSTRDIGGASGSPLDYDHVQKLLDESSNEDVKNEIMEELHCINDVAERGQDYLEIAKSEFGIETPDDEPRERTAMRLFLNENADAFQMAYDLYSYRTEAADLSHHKFRDGQASFSKKHLDQFKDAIGEHYRKQAKGEDCDIRHYVEGDNHIIFVARGDFVKTQQVWENSKIKNSYFRPAKEDILVFNTKNCILSLKSASRNKDDKIESIKAFGYHVLGKHKIEDEVFEKSLVSLVPIQNGSFNYEGNEYIKWVKLVEVQMRIPKRGFIKLKINSNDLVSSLERFLHISLEDGELISAKLKFKIEQDGKSQKPLTVELRPPERTSLTKKRDITIIEEYLRENEVLLI
jgi:hypothetical protein